LPDDELTLDLPAVLQKVRELSVLKDQVKVLKKREEEIKALLIELVDIEGEEDEKGHKVFALPESIGGIGSLVRQRRVSRPLDADVAQDILESIVTDSDFGRTLWNDCIEMVPHLDEDKIMEAHFNGLLTEDQVDAMFPEVVSWAFTTPK